LFNFDARNISKDIGPSERKENIPFYHQVKQVLDKFSTSLTVCTCYAVVKTSASVKLVQYIFLEFLETPEQYVNWIGLKWLQEKDNKNKSKQKQTCHKVGRKVGRNYYTKFTAH